MITCNVRASSLDTSSSCCRIVFSSSPFTGFSLQQLLLFFVHAPPPTSPPLTSFKVGGWGGVLKYKAVLVKNLSKSGLIAKFNSKDPFWKLRTKMEPSIGLAVSRTLCPYCRGERGGEQEINLILLVTMF